MPIPHDLNPRAPENELALAVTYLLVRSALGWFVGMFLFGGIAGWSVPQWSVNRAVALWGLTIPLVAAVLIGVGYYYTNGTMAAREYPTDPSSPGRHPSSP